MRLQLFKRFKIGRISFDDGEHLGQFPSISPEHITLLLGLRLRKINTVYRTLGRYYFLVFLKFAVLSTTWFFFFSNCHFFITKWNLNHMYIYICILYHFKWNWINSTAVMISINDCIVVCTVQISFIEEPLADQLVKFQLILWQCIFSV